MSTKESISVDGLGGTLGGVPAAVGYAGSWGELGQKVLCRMEHFRGGHGPESGSLVLGDDAAFKAQPVVIVIVAVVVIVVVVLLLLVLLLLGGARVGRLFAL